MFPIARGLPSLKGKPHAHHAHPQSRAGDQAQPQAAELVAIVHAAGHEVRYVSCASDDWQGALGESADLVAVAGGDGTVGRVAKALVGRNLPFTTLPLGTANNISRTLGLAETPLAQLAAGWSAARHVWFDVGVARGPWGMCHFVEGFGAGLFACTMRAADENRTLENLPEAQAKVAYALQMLRDRLGDCAAQALAVKLDGRDLSGDYVLAEAMNMQYVGPNLYLAPDCDLRDGLLDVVLVPFAQRGRLLRYLSEWQNGMLWPPDLPTYRGERLELEWTGYEVHIDDRVWPERGGAPVAARGRIEVTLQRDALRFLLPG